MKLQGTLSFLKEEGNILRHAEDLFLRHRTSSPFLSVSVILVDGGVVITANNKTRKASEGSPVYRSRLDCRLSSKT